MCSARTLPGWTPLLNDSRSMMVGPQWYGSQCPCMIVCNLEAAMRKPRTPLLGIETTSRTELESHARGAGAKRGMLRSEKRKLAVKDKDHDRRTERRTLFDRENKLY